MIYKSLTAMAFLTLLVGCGSQPAQTGDTASSERPVEADLPPVTAQLRGPDGAELGQVTMRRGPLGLLFTVEGQGWPQGWHGAHLHAVGSCEGPAFESAGAHVNHPGQARPHGLLNWDGGPDHGDLQNIYAHVDGTARAEVYLSGAGLNPGVGDMADADGLAFVVHANPDDHTSQPIGGAGGRIACAVLSPPS